MDTKPWYQSKTIIAGIGTFLAGLAMVAKFFFQVDIADQVPILSGGLLAVLALVGSVVTVYGRFTAKTIIAPKDDLPTVGGPLIRLLLVGALMGTCLSLPGCANLSQSLPYVRTGASVACGTVLRMAVSDQDRVDVANDIFVIGSVFDSLSGGAVPTPEELRAAIAVASPKAAEFTWLASTLVDVYVRYYPQIQGNPRLALELLREMARGCDDAAASYLSPRQP